MGAIKSSLFIIKLLLMAAIMWFFYDKIDLSLIGSRLLSIQKIWIISALLTLFTQLLLTGVRWYLVGIILGAKINLGLSVRLTLIGQFFNQVLPLSVGGDGVRAWLASRGGISLRQAFSTVICDRLAALIMLMIIAGATMPFALLVADIKIPSALTLAMVVDGFTFLALLMLFLWGGKFSSWLISLPPLNLLGRILRDLRLVLFSPKKSLLIVGISITVQIMVFMTIYFCGLALRVDLHLVNLLILPLILFVASIPISFAGWGLRESAMVVGLGFMGISANDALVISICFGVAQLLIGLPGILFFSKNLLNIKPPLKNKFL
jgi:uncharacterized membrane protein YbhN (UPF0104 family)